MKFLLDANAVIGVLAGNAGLLAEVRRQAPRDIGIPAVAMHELFLGVR